MSRRGNCHDNAVMESWFATVKSEEGEHFEGYAHAKAALFDYIEVFYSQRRRTRRSARSARRPSSACQRTPHSQTVHRIGSSQDNRRSVSVGTVRLTGKLTGVCQFSFIVRSDIPSRSGSLDWLGRMSVSCKGPQGALQRWNVFRTGPDWGPWRRLWRVARPAGLEPATPSLEGSCSIQLSYGRLEPWYPGVATATTPHP